MIVDGFEILGLHAVPKDGGLTIGVHRHVANKVLYKNRIIIRALGHRFFVRTLEHAV